MNQSGQKLWGLLLVVDSFFVVIFGGAFAANLYESWQNSGHELSAPVHPFKPIPSKPLRAVSSIPQPLKPATPQTPATASPKPASSPAPKAQKNKISQPKPARAQEPQILPSRGLGKARGVIFDYYGRKARHVFLIASFIRGGEKPFKKTKRGPWKAKVFLMPGNYHYQFMVDGKKILDPRNPRHKGRFSYFSLEK